MHALGHSDTGKFAWDPKRVVKCYLTNNSVISFRYFDSFFHLCLCGACGYPHPSFKLFRLNYSALRYVLWSGRSKTNEILCLILKSFLVPIQVRGIVTILIEKEKEKEKNETRKSVWRDLEKVNIIENTIRRWTRKNAKRLVRLKVSRNHIYSHLYFFSLYIFIYIYIYFVFIYLYTVGGGKVTAPTGRENRPRIVEE